MASRSTETSAPSEARAYLITGVTGFLGKVVLEHLLREREALSAEHIYVLIRPQRKRSAEERFRAEVADSACFSRLPQGWDERVTVVSGELSSEGCGLSEASRAELAQHVTHIIHSAASVEFDLPIAEAAASNINASLHVLELARTCRRLRSLVSVSTAYVTPHPGDARPIEEALAPLPRPAETLYREVLDGSRSEGALLAETRHPNTYTFTKCLAEHLLAERGADLPLSIVRPSIISASWRDPFPGWIDSEAAFAAFVALVGSGYLRAVVGNPRTRLDIVPVDEVARRILEAGSRELERRGGAPPIHHAVAGPDRSSAVAACGDRITDFFRRNRLEAGRKPRVHYLGPPGRRYALAHRMHHKLPIRLGTLASSRARRRGRRLLSRLEYVNEVFPYFTQRSFHFNSSLPFEDPRFDPHDYVSTVCAGVFRHLLSGR